MKKLLLSMCLISFFMFSCGNENSKTSECSDMDSYNKGVRTGKDNKNMVAECDYFWQMDNDGNMSKGCYCKGYNSVDKEF